MDEDSNIDSQGQYTISHLPVVFTNRRLRTRDKRFPESEIQQGIDPFKSLGQAST